MDANPDRLGQIQNELIILADQFQADWQRARVAPHGTMRHRPASSLMEQYAKLVDQLLIEAYNLGGFQADPRWRNVISIKRHEQRRWFLESCFLAMCETLRLPAINLYGFEFFWATTDTGNIEALAKAMRFIASRVALVSPRIDKTAKKMQRRLRRERYRLSAEKRVIRSPYIEAQQADA